jgi:3-methyladenine DNA glycosylase/8-oxoguanine DNA glycosylase
MRALYTIGHSTRALDELAAALRAFGVTVLADVRTVPRSRHNPQFNAPVRIPGIRYVHLPSLGGLRHPRRDSENTGWRNGGFRGFADQMQTPEFESGVAQLLALPGTVAIMCAEAVPWRCHRSLISDALTVRGVKVEHISSPTHASLHRLAPFARVDGTRVTYPLGALWTPAPFHLEATVRVLQRRPLNRVDVWAGDHYVREGVEVRNLGTVDAPDVRYTGEADPARIRRVLGLDLDPKRWQRKAEAEPKLRATARGLRGMRPPRFPTLFETFANVIPFQQVSVDAGAAIVARLVDRFGEGGFPTAETIAAARPARLQACGLSGTKARSLRHLARRVASGELTEAQLDALPSDEAMRLLVDLPGIGPWSAGLILLRGLGRLDVFPMGDVGVARGLKGLSLARSLERFGDVRGYLYFCAIGGALLKRGLIHPAPAPQRLTSSTMRMRAPRRKSPSLR